MMFSILKFFGTETVTSKSFKGFMSFFHNLWRTSRWLCTCSREGGDLFLLHFINVGDIARVKSGDPLSFNQRIVV